MHDRAFYELCLIYYWLDQVLNKIICEEINKICRDFRKIAEITFFIVNRAHHAHESLLQPPSKQGADKKKLKKRKERDIKRRGQGGQGTGRW